MVPAFTLTRGDTHALVIGVERPGVDLSTATITAELRRAAGGVKLADYTITATFPRVGVADLTLQIPATTTAALPAPSRLVGELKIADTGGTVHRPARWLVDIGELVHT